MKKSLLLLFSFLVIVSSFAQDVPRNFVAIEDATGTWCTYCPGAAMGCDDLLENGQMVAVIANHNGSNYANTYSNARNSMYNVQAYPSVAFDGTKCYVGGDHSNSLYDDYLPVYNSLISINSPVAMSMVVTNTGLDYTAVITLTKVGTITSTSNILYFFVTQSHIHQHWQGQDSLQHVNRLMVPNQNGTAVDFSSGDTQVITLNFTMDAAWPLANCEFIAFLQNKDSGQGNQSGYPNGYPLKKFVVYQTIKQGAIDLTADFIASDTAVTTNEPVAFTNLTVGGYQGVTESYEWLFPGATPSTSIERNPTVTYTDAGDYDVTLIVNRGGQIDTVTKTAYIKSSFPAGIKENSNFTHARVFPNPNSGTFIFSMNVEKATVADLTITNAAGLVFYKESGVEMSGQVQETIQISNLAAGIYYLTVQNSDSKSAQKIIVR